MRTLAARIALLFWLAICAVIAGGPRGGQAADLRALLPQAGAAELTATDAWWASKPEAGETVPAAVARLVYQVQRLPREVIEDPAQRQRVTPATSPLEPVAIAGRIERVRQLRVPAELIEFLEFDSLWLVEVRDDAAGEVSALLKAIPERWTPAMAAGQPVEIGGVSIASAEATGPLVLGRFLHWYPDRAGPGIPRAWVALAQQGVDSAALSQLAERGGQPLAKEDHDVFYQLLAAAPKLGDALVESTPETPLAKLLADAEALAGHGVRLPLWTRRVTRVEITDPELRRQAGTEAYWQIDAFGDLQGTSVRLDLPDASGASVVFGPRFPVTVITRELPPELERAMRREAGGPAAQALVDRPITVGGVFFRLVAYETDYVRRQGGETQVGPLVIAAWVRDAEAGGIPQSSFRQFNGIVAGVFFLGLLSAIGWILWTGRRDARFEQARRQSTPARLPAFDEFEASSAAPSSPAPRPPSAPQDAPPT